jgi:hypothetical protein
MRYLVGILLVIFFLILGTALLLGGNDNGNGGKTARFTRLAEYENSDGASVSWTQQGRIVGDDQYRAIRVTVTRNTRRIEILNGYQERVERSADFSSTPAAFATFTRALDNQAFGKERDVRQPDDRGVCPLGNRYVYRLTDGPKEIMRTWSDTCQNADGPFGGGPNAVSTIQQLFQAQVPNYSSFITNVQL